MSEKSAIERFIINCISVYPLNHFMGVSNGKKYFGIFSCSTLNGHCEKSPHRHISGPDYNSSNISLGLNYGSFTSFFVLLSLLPLKCVHYSQLLL